MREADSTVMRMFQDPYYVTTTEMLGKLARALGVKVGRVVGGGAGFVT